jgi:hypothetical protein
MSGDLTFAFDGLPGGAIARLTEAIIYVSSVCEVDEAFGSTRLNKILFEADFDSFLTRGVPVTGASYQRLQNGPAPKAMPRRIKDLTESGELQIRLTDYLGKPQKKPIPLRRPNLSFFSGEDVAFLHRAIHDSWGKSGRKVSDASHRIEWLTRENGDLIPYEAALLSNEGVTPEEVSRTKELALEHGW